MTTQEIRQAQTRRAILDAARDLLVERGPDGFSLREVARRVNYTPTGLYEYFPSKQALIDAVLDEGFGHFVQLMLTIPADLAPDARLRAIGRTYLQFADTHPAYFTLIARHIALDQAPPHVTASTFGVLEATVQDCIDGGLIPAGAGSADTIAFACWSLVHGMAQLRNVQLRHVAADWSTVVEGAIAAFVAGLAVAPVPPAPVATPSQPPQESAMSDKIMTLHPQGKQGVNISRAKYDQIRAAILDALAQDGELTFTELSQTLGESLAGKFDGSIGWYTTTVKLDLEARGILRARPKTSPPRWYVAEKTPA